jgi:hypothetical protein
MPWFSTNPGRGDSNRQHVCGAFTPLWSVHSATFSVEKRNATKNEFIFAGTTIARHWGMKTLIPFVCLTSMLSFSACSIDLESEPEGPTAKDAQQAWPTKPTVEPISLESITRACIAYTACDADNALGLMQVEICLTDLAWSAERAIPISTSNLLFSVLGDTNERAEFFVDCVEKSKDCGEIKGCITSREADFSCEEDGCKANTTYSVSCDGTVAVMTTDNSTIRRDCARVFGECDSKSPTGCTDRHYTASPSSPPQPDRCDGDVRLGCDSLQQVSYRDCSRLNGVCKQTEDSAICHYGDAICVKTVRCEGETLHACLDGASATVQAPHLCPPPDQP